MKAKNTHGGKRPGSGAKRKTDKKQAIFIYIPASMVEKLGGYKSCKAFAEAALVRKCNSVSKIV